MPDTDQPTQFRPGKYLDEKLTERAVQADEETDRKKMSKDAIAKRDLTRWYDMLEANTPTFSMDEARLLCAALNGVRCSAGTLYGNIVTSDAMDYQYDGVDKAVLLERIRSLDDAQAWSVIDAVERAWNAPTYGNIDLRKRVVLVGLVK